MRGYRCRLVKEGKLSMDEAKKQTRMLANVKVRKAGDVSRILLMNLVKSGHITIEDAVDDAKKMGVDVDTGRGRFIALADLRLIRVPFGS